MNRTPLWTSLAAAVLAVQMSGRILTPNGDGIHDNVSFTVPAGLAAIPRAQVFDVHGRRVSGLAAASPTQLRWDGRDYAGRVVESGVYLVQISADAALWNGVVSVAK
jgi:hypothetical protein